MRRPPCAALLAAVLSLAALVPAGPAGAASVPEFGDQQRSQAQEALTTVEALLSGSAQQDMGRGPGPADQPGGEGGHTDGGRELTLALRDLALARDDLQGSERRAAAAYLARPDDNRGAPYSVRYRTDEEPKTCREDVCVHRVASTDDAAGARFAGRVLKTFQGVHQTYVDAGYREPRSDRTARNNGGNGKTDIYLADIGDQGIYGYCTSDQPFELGVFDSWAYCVLDNDYARGQYPDLTPLQNMEVTAAHEYFHAVQFAYDTSEDPWLMEGTATWAEDELFDSVNDNVSYLDRGPAGVPARPLDLNRGGLEVYGAWGFWRYLTEQLPAQQGGMPTLVRHVWEEADSVRGDELYSLRALARVLKERGTTVRTGFADYVAANRFPRQRYEEGSEYPRAPLAGQRTLSRSQASYRFGGRLSHLAGATVRLKPETDLARRVWALRLRLDLPDAVRGSQVRVSVTDTEGATRTDSPDLRRDGDLTIEVPFSATRVESVEVHLVNASTRIKNCFSLGDVSCQGVARDDRLPVRLRASVVRS